MKKIIYPNDIIGFKREYLRSVYGDKIHSMQNDWARIRKSNDILRNHFPKRITKILLEDYPKLVKYYLTYIHFSEQLNAIRPRLETIFNYAGFQSSIAKFFMTKATDLNITTCYYCETAFINVYKVDNVEKECLMKFNSEPFDKLKKRLNTKSDAIVKEIMDGRPYQSVEEFNEKWLKLPRTRNNFKFESMFNLYSQRNHFDIDHALDKGSCPLISLSLMNFVPCCQVCNEKLKRSLVLGNYLQNEPKAHLSPSSPYYDFDNQVRLQLEPIIPPTGGAVTLDPAYALDNSDKYILKFECADKSYESLVEIFRLNERYEFHKCEGLYWLSMRAKYNDANIQLIANSLSDSSFTTGRIHEDIFREEYDNKRHPCFAKFKRDVLK